MHHPLYAIKLYGLTVGYTVGWIILAMAVAGLILFVWQQGLRQRTLPVYVLLVPLAFYWLVLYRGINSRASRRWAAGDTTTCASAC